MIIKQDYLKISQREGCDSLFVPTEYVIKKLYYYLSIQEHINKICLGLHYVKDESILKTVDFQRIVTELLQYGHADGEAKIEETTSGESAAQMINMTRRKPNYKINHIRIKNLYWRNKFRNFVFQSDEKWILEQYNLMKYFLILNSIEVMSTVNHTNLTSKTTKHESGWYSTNHSDTDGSKPRNANEIKFTFKSDNSQKEGQKEEQELYVPKAEDEILKVIDVNALIDTFTEIEYKDNMHKILNNRQINLESLKNLNDDIEFSGESETR